MEKRKLSECQFSYAFQTIFFTLRNILINKRVRSRNRIFCNKIIEDDTRYLFASSLGPYGQLITRVVFNVGEWQGRSRGKTSIPLVDDAEDAERIDVTLHFSP